MKKRTMVTWSIAVLGVVASLYFSSFKTASYAPAGIIDDISQQYRADLNAFAQQTKKLDAAAQAITQGDEPISHLQTTFLETRDAFKKIEWLAEYYHAEAIKFQINGAPLRHLPTDDGGIIEDPIGLQILEEYIFSDDPAAEDSMIQYLTASLVTSSKDLTIVDRTVSIRHNHVFEAIRLELIRILSLSITGFDTPMTLRGLEESQITLRVMRDALSRYYPLLDDRKAGLSSKIEGQFTGAIQYLETNQDFDSFDRLEFLKKYLNPLFALVLDAHQGLGIPDMYETHPYGQKFSINYYTSNIFSDSLINPFFYSEQIEPQHTAATIELGKMLFFDPILSKSVDRSCASCHQPEKAFTDGQVKSIASGFEGTVDRNSPTLINAALAERLFYDLRATKLENQIGHVIFDEREFNTNFFEIFERLKQSPEYVKMFKAAYPNLGERSIHQYTFNTAIASYLISLVDYSSPFDLYVQGKTDEIDPAVRKGFNLFMGKAGCGTCHFAPNFSGLVPPTFMENESEVLGLPLTPDTLNPTIDPDIGRMNGQFLEFFDIFAHSFKTTTVRNVGMTAPYMHNGAYETLDQVVDFYNRGGGVGLGLDVPNQTLPPDPLELTKQEQADLVAFMMALTNTEIPTERPTRLPAFPEGSPYQERTIGGEY